ncbi:MAG TPA: chemotaxis protein CheW [bacterium]|nr:chemotaxis protein CheW [bacterium]
MSAGPSPLADQQLVFRLGRQVFGVEAALLWETSSRVAFTEVPKTQGNLEGVTQMHGKIIPVLNLAAILGVKRRPPSGGFVAVKIPWPSELLAGFVVDEVVGFLRTAGGGARPAGADFPYARAWDGVVALLDMPKLVADQVNGGKDHV